LVKFKHHIADPAHYRRWFLPWFSRFRDTSPDRYGFRNWLISNVTGEIVGYNFWEFLAVLREHITIIHNWNGYNPTGF